MTQLALSASRNAPNIAPDMATSMLIPIVLAGAVTLIGAGLAWVIKSVIANSREVAVLRGSLEDDGGADVRIDAAVAKERLWVREQFISREDYVPAIARLEVKMDTMAEVMHRLEERQK